MPRFTADDVVVLTEVNTYTFDRWCDLGAVAGRVAALLPKREFRRAVARMVKRMVVTEQYGVLVEAMDALEAHAAPALLATLRPSDFLPALTVGGYHEFVRERAICFHQHVGATAPNR